MQDISKNWSGSTTEEVRAMTIILSFEGTPGAVLAFERYKDVFDDYWYWFVLSTLWVSYSGWSDLKKWKKMFRSPRLKRATSIMKPSELKVFNLLPTRFIVYRAHRPNETDWISYTLDKSIADRWAMERGGYVQSYTLKKSDCLALFLRRGEKEILMLDPKRAKALIDIRGEKTV